MLLSPDRFGYSDEEYPAASSELIMQVTKKITLTILASILMCGLVSAQKQTTAQLNRVSSNPAMQLYAGPVLLVWESVQI